MQLVTGKRIAITGGIAEGKSTVLGWLREDGWQVASSDDAARELFSDPAHNSRLAELVGLPAPVTPAALRTRMLESAEVRRSVNRYLHPKIGEINRASSATFFEVPLLIEACLQTGYDEVWVVTCGEVEQRRRLLDRYANPELVESLLAVQLPTSVKCVFADWVCRTNGDYQSVRRSLEEQAMKVKC